MTTLEEAEALNQTITEAQNKTRQFEYDFLVDNSEALNQFIQDLEDDIKSFTDGMLSTSSERLQLLSLLDQARATINNVQSRKAMLEMQINPPVYGN